MKEIGMYGVKSIYLTGKANQALQILMEELDLGLSKVVQIALLEMLERQNLTEGEIK